MKKFVAKICLWTLLVNYVFMLIPLDVKATTSSEESYTTRNVCGNNPYELAYANQDGSLTNKSCHATYQDAKKTMDESTEANSDNLVILERNSSITTIIDAKYAIVDLNKGNNNQNTNILNSGDSSDGTVYTYINGNAAYGAVDAAYLGINIENKRIQIKIGGVTGWIKEQEAGYKNYKLIPLAWVKSTTKYVVTDSSIAHYTTSNINATTSSNNITLGPKPTMVPTGTYYSYDGIYFYQDRKMMLLDYKNGSTEHAVNNGSPYYNYYLYLPHHTKTTYSGSDIDNYLKKTYDDVLKYNYTMLYGTGYAFYNIQETYGINAILMLSVARNESAEGKSKYATVRNNLFGHGAVDSNPDNATLYSSIRAGIMAHATSYIGYGYAFPSNYRFYGSHLGNKIMGANVKYASDPYWGEKAAANYYALDLANGLQDYNYYQIAIKSKTGTIYPSYLPKTGEQYRISTKTATISEPYYNYGRLGSPVVIVEEVTGDTVDGSNLWYKIISDANIDQNHKFVENNGNPVYNWDTNYVYVPASYYTKINNVTAKGPDSITEYPEKNYTYETYTTNGNPTPQVAKINQDNTTLYLNPSLDTVSPRSWNKGQYVVVFEKAYDENGTLRAYQISSTYKKGWKEWVTPESISFVPMTYGKVRIYNGTYANVRVSPGGTAINDSSSGLANGTYVVILDQKIVNGVTWVQIDYDGRLGWVVQKDADQEITLTKSTLQNNAPVITANNQTIVIGSNFNPLLGVTATDSEDGNISSKVKVESSNVNTNKVGTYQVTYIVTDSGGLTARKTVQITVKDLEEQAGLFYYQSLTSKGNNQFEFSGFLGIKHMNNKRTQNITHKLVFVNQNTKEEHTLPLNRWLDNYPFEMTDMDDTQNLDYSGGWFKSTVDLSGIPYGDYIVYVEVTNGFYKSRVLFNNIFNESMDKGQSNSNRAYEFSMNYYKRTMPLELTIRKNNIAEKKTPTSEEMFNFYDQISFSGNNLNILGMSYSYKVSYDKNQTVKRSIVLENATTFERTEYNVGYIDNGPYDVVLRAPDGLDKTRAWYKAELNIANLNKGTYVLYIKNEVGSTVDYGELKNIMESSINKTTTINGKKFSLKINTDRRSRIELIVE